MREMAWELSKDKKYNVHELMWDACRKMNRSDTRVSLLRFGDAHQQSVRSVLERNTFVTVPHTSGLQNGCPRVILRDLKIDMWCCFRLHCPDTLRCYTWHHQYEYRPCALTDIQAVSAVLQLAWHYQSSCCLPGEYCARHKWLTGMAVL